MRRTFHGLIVDAVRNCLVEEYNGPLLVDLPACSIDPWNFFVLGTYGVVKA
jgi:hypothetical protein